MELKYKIKNIPAKIVFRLVIEETFFQGKAKIIKIISGKPNVLL